MSVYFGPRLPQSENLISLVDAGNPKTASSGNINDLIAPNTSWARSSGSYPMNNDTQNGVFGDFDLIASQIAVRASGHHFGDIFFRQALLL